VVGHVLNVPWEGLHVFCSFEIIALALLYVSLAPAPPYRVRLQQVTSTRDSSPGARSLAGRQFHFLEPELGIQLGSQCIQLGIQETGYRLALFIPELGMQGIQEIHDVFHGLQLS
jgi:hypothetical protein